LGLAKKKRIGPWLGYGEGDTAYISAPQQGWVTLLKIERGGLVHRGDLLFVLDSVREQGRGAGSGGEPGPGPRQPDAGNRQPGLCQDHARQAELGWRATMPAPPPSAIWRCPTIASPRARTAQLRSQIAQMEAGLKSASYGLGQRDIVAQTDGRVQDIYFREGEYVPAATPVVAVLPPKNVLCPLLRARTRTAARQGLAARCDTSLATAASLSTPR